MLSFASFTRAKKEKLKADREITVGPGQDMAMGKMGAVRLATST